MFVICGLAWLVARGEPQGDGGGEKGRGRGGCLIGCIVSVSWSTGMSEMGDLAVQVSPPVKYSI